MTISEYGEMDATALSALVRAGELHPVEVLEEAISRAERINPELNFLAHEAFGAGRQAAADPALPMGPLAGVPWLVKELATSWEGQPFTNSLPYIKDMLGPVDAVIVSRLKAAGAVLFGKSTSPENGWSLATESSLHGVTLSPWDKKRTPGGSSGGSAVAVATRVTPISDASDGGGSIRVPAANCGLIGLKPSRGRITLQPTAVDYWYGGALIFGLSRTVRDTALMLDVLQGGLPGEPYRLSDPNRSYVDEAATNPGQLRVALVTDAPDHGTPVDPQIKAAVEAAGKLLEGLGHVVEPHSAPYEYWPLYKQYTALIAVQTAAFIDAMAAPVGRPATADDMANLYWTMVEKGRRMTATDHSNHIEGVRQMSCAMATTMDGFDVWLMPTLPMLPRTHGYYDTSLEIETYDETRMGPDSCFTAPFNASGAPAISLPLGMSDDGLPIGVQLVGRIGDEAGLLNIAGQLERAGAWPDRRPPICS
jgi:amidase